MNKTEILEIINANLAFHLATVDEGEPRVRGMMLYKADEEGIVFHTGKMKEVYAQIKKNPNAEMCFNDFKNGVQVRVRGQLEELTDKAVKDEIAEHPTRRFVKEWRESGELADFYNTFAVFRMRGGKALVWTMQTNFAPKEWVEL